MARIPGLRRLFRLPPSRGTLARDVDEEIAFHLDSRIADLVAQGLTPAAARQRAEQHFGDVAEARAELLEIDRLTLLRERRADRWEAAVHELRLAARSLRRSPGFTAAVVLMLALGIGVNAAMFGLTDRLLFSAPPHVQDADELVRVYYQSTPPWVGELSVEPTMPYADYVVQRDEVTAFSEVAAYVPPVRAVLGRGVDATELRLMTATPSYLRILGVAPALGRFFTEAEGAEPEGERVVVLSHAFWRTEFGGDAGVLGRAIEIDHATFTVIGVAPRGFHGIDLDPVQAWVPISATARGLGQEWYSTRAMAWIRIIARLAPGVSAEAAAEQATAAYLAPDDYQVRYADDPTARIVLGSIIAARAPAAGIGTPQRSGRIALWLLGVSTVVVIIACANVTNLLLARGLRRRREVGVRMALGVSRYRLAGQVGAETALIALAGAVLGLLLAHWGGHFARTLLLPDFDWAGSPLDRRVLLFAALVAVACVLLAGLLPALHAARADVAGLLALGGRGGGWRRSPLRSGLVVLQAALSVLLLVGAGLFVRSLHNARNVSLGYEPERVALLVLHRTGLDWSAATVRDMYDRSLERVHAVPGVEAAALAMTAPLWDAAGASVRVPGLEPTPRPPGMFGYLYNAVTPDFFAALGTRVLRGRAFTDADAAGAAPVAIVTASMARLLWPGEDALGRCFVHALGGDDPCREVVGVVESPHNRFVEGEPDVMFFIPLAQAPPYPMRVLIVRTHGEPQHAFGHLRAALGDIDPGMPHVRAQLLRHLIDPQLQPWRLGALLFSAFGLLALLLAGLGLYGVIAYDVTQRTRELGVRVALGARARNVAALVLGDAFRFITIGLLIGLAVALWAGPRIEVLLFGVAPRDHMVLAAVAALLLLVGALAALLPGWRATRVQPIEALREE